MLAEYTLLKMILASATLLWRRRPRRVCRPQVLDEGTIYFQKKIGSSNSKDCRLPGRLPAWLVPASGTGAKQLPARRAVHLRNC